MVRDFFGSKANEKQTLFFVKCDKFRVANYFKQWYIRFIILKKAIFEFIVA
jgi:hypothetical protein